MFEHLLHTNMRYFCPYLYYTVTYKIQWLNTPPFGHFMRIAHVTVAPSTGAGHCLNKLKKHGLP